MHVGPEEVLVHFDEKLAETPKAYLFSIDGDKKEWIPKSQILDKEKPDSTSGCWRLVIPIWLAKAKGLV